MSRDCKGAMGKYKRLLTCAARQRRAIRQNSGHIHPASADGARDHARRTVEIAVAASDKYGVIEAKKGLDQGGGVLVQPNHSSRVHSECRRHNVWATEATEAQWREMRSSFRRTESKPDRKLIGGHLEQMKRKCRQFR